MSEDTPVGKTMSQGWEIGVRRTLPVSVEHLWALLTTPPGLGLWLSVGTAPAFRKGETFTTHEQTTGEIVSYTEGSLIRLRWQPRGWHTPSTLQIRVLPAKRGATLSIHHEKLTDGEQREAMRRHWSAVIDALERLIGDRP